MNNTCLAIFSSFFFNFFQFLPFSQFQIHCHTFQHEKIWSQEQSLLLGIRRGWVIGIGAMGGGQDVSRSHDIIKDGKFLNASGHCSIFMIILPGTWLLKDHQIVRLHKRTANLAQHRLTGSQYLTRPRLFSITRPVSLVLHLISPQRSVSKNTDLWAVFPNTLPRVQGIF